MRGVAVVLLHLSQSRRAWSVEVAIPNAQSVPLAIITRLGADHQTERSRGRDGLRDGGQGRLP